MKRIINKKKKRKIMRKNSKIVYRIIKLND